MNRKDKERGFTLLEIIAVLIVLGIIAAIVVVRYLSQQNDQSISQVEIFKSHLRYAQQLSINGDSTITWGIQIGAGTTSYSLVQIQNNSVTGILPGEIGNTHTFPSGVTLTGVNANQIISFDQWGSPGNSSLTINVVDGSVTNSFTITQKTGFIQ